MTVKLRLLSNRRDELVSARIQAVCRIHRDLVVLLPGGRPSGCWPNTLASAVRAPARPVRLTVDSRPELPICAAGHPNAGDLDVPIHPA